MVPSKSSSKSSTATRTFPSPVQPAPQKKPRTLSQIMDERRQEKMAGKKPVKEEPEYLKKEKSVHYCIKDGFFTSIKSGFTESFIMAFAVAMNASTGMLSVLASVPQLVASFFQLFAQESLRFFKTRRRLIFITSLIQSCMWIPLLFIPFVAKEWAWLILVFVTLETTFGTFQGPIYTSILGDIVSDDKRGEFFGKRNRVVNLMNFVSTIIAGLILSYFEGLDTAGQAFYVFYGFAILFSIAFIARAIAAYYKSKIYDPPFTPSEHTTSFKKFLKNMSHDNYGIFVIYVFLFKFATAISMPFFVLYLLKDMQMGYLYFTIIMGASIVASFLAMTFWGKIIDRHGSKRVLAISGFLIPLSPFLLILAIFIKDPLMLFIYLLVEEMLSGVVWAGFNLSTSSFLFDATNKEERIKHIAYYNFLVGIAIFLGAVLGGVLINIGPIWGVSAIPFIYLISGILRLLATSIMIKKVHEARMVEVHVPGRSFFHRVISVPPHFGSTIEIIGVEHHAVDSRQHEIVKKTEKRPSQDPVKPNERALYEKKSFEYYKENALKTMTEKEKQPPPRDDSDKIEKKIEQEKKKITELTEQLKKRNMK